MLDTMRRMSKGIVAKALMVLLIVSFAFWGVGDILGNSGVSYAAKVGSETVTVSEFQRAKAEMARAFAARKIPLDGPQLDVEVIRQLVQEKLILQSMNDLGLYPNEKMLANELKNMPEFQKNDGTFSRDRFKLALRAQQTTEAAYLSELKNETVGTFLVHSLAMDDITPPDNVIALAAAAASQTRDAVIVTIPAQRPAPITDADLNTYYEQTKSIYYLAPETRTFEYVTVSAADIRSLVEDSITPQMFEDAVAANPATSEARLMEDLRTEQRDPAMRALTNALEDAIAAGDSLAEAAKKAGLSATPRTLSNLRADAANPGADDVTRTIIEQGFTMGSGEISGLISTPRGTNLIVALTAINPAAPKPYDTVKTDVRTRLTQQRVREATSAYAQTVKTALANSTDWKAALAPFKLSGRLAKNLTRPLEGSVDRDGIPVLLQQSVFERNVGEIAGPLPLPSGSQMIALVNATRFPKIVATDKISPQISTSFSKILNDEVQNRAVNYFANRHPVKLNPELIQPATSGKP